MIGAAPEPVDVTAFRKLWRTVRLAAAKYLAEGSIAGTQAELDLSLAAIEYAEAVKTARRARRTRR